MKSIAKKLSQNDTGENGTHQAGILVPKDEDILGFFPRLDGTRKNPRVSIDFLDEDGDFWRFSFIYYNNKFFGGTRNEYRLTGMTKFMRETGARAGDALLFSLDDSGRYHIKLEREGESGEENAEEKACRTGDGRIRINASASWKVITI